MAAGGNNLHFKINRNPRGDHETDHTGEETIPTRDFNLGCCAASSMDYR